MQIKNNLDKLEFDSQGLIPAIVQEYGSGKILMLAYMNKESLEKTIETGQTWFYSRSRKKLWHKGATSGNYQDVVSIKFDCDHDCLLIKVEQKGSACHTGSKSCFFNDLTEDHRLSVNFGEILVDLFGIIENRKHERPEGSYTSYLFNEGQDKILKKLGEETAETVIASKNKNKDEVVNEMADLWYHSLVLLAYHGINLEDIIGELANRKK